MTWRHLIGVLALLVAVPAAAQQTEAPLVPELKVTIGPEAALSTNAYVDGQSVLAVQLLSRHPFESLSLKLPSVSNAKVIELLRPRTRKITSYAGEGYAFETSVAMLGRLILGNLGISSFSYTTMILKNS